MRTLTTMPAPGYGYRYPELSVKALRADRCHSGGTEWLCRGDQVLSVCRRLSGARHLRVRRRDATRDQGRSGWPAVLCWPVRTRAPRRGDAARMCPPGATLRRAADGDALALRAQPRGRRGHRRARVCRSRSWLSKRLARPRPYCPDCSDRSAHGDASCEGAGEGNRHLSIPRRLPQRVSHRHDALDRPRWRRARGRTGTVMRQARHALALPAASPAERGLPRCGDACACHA